ncbi:hypothetical protein KFK09_013144 [Dendrobium nobile]|uniref:Uncharacterized protein n=1 Tax=Dendrobium nobile TaxID=94219 RepID=A0A8T3B991_DENNO|nr:hypothetical protein KFK09_013144 [Dendrobium nobile]
MIFLSRKLFHFHRSAAHAPTHLPSLYLPILFSFSSTAENSSVKSTFMVDYLIGTIGLSSEAAIKSSKSLSHIKSPSKPDAVLHFLKESGFNDACIRYMVSKNSRILTAKVETTLKPKMIALKKFGFSESEILQLVSKNPVFLIHGGIQSKIKFWRGFLGSKENLLHALLRGKRLICSNLDTNIIPKISFLRDCGFLDNQIASMINNNPNFIVMSLDSIKRLKNRAEELGFSYGSGAFCSVMVSLCQISRATMESKLKLLGSFGWSEAEVSSVIRKAPLLLETSEKKMKKMMDFLVKRAGCEPSFVMKHPRLLMFSLERRMVPRQYVLQLLKSKDLIKRKLSFYSFMTISEKKFLEKYILSYGEKMPDLYQVYLALYSGNSTV